MVLLETALSIPLLAFVAVGLAWALTVASASLSLGDAARSAARGIARGESVDDAVARATASVPGATAQLETSGDEAVVVITDVVRAPIPLLAGIPVTITQRVAIPKEWM
ncbi:MAG: TadE family type IV pilus minor pilin [Actinomycetes bacterium]